MNTNSENAVPLSNPAAILALIAGTLSPCIVGLLMAYCFVGDKGDVAAEKVIVLIAPPWVLAGFHALYGRWRSHVTRTRVVILSIAAGASLVISLLGAILFLPLIPFGLLAWIVGVIIPALPCAALYVTVRRSSMLFATPWRKQAISGCLVGASLALAPFIAVELEQSRFARNCEWLEQASHKPLDAKVVREARRRFTESDWHQLASRTLLPRFPIDSPLGLLRTTWELPLSALSSNHPFEDRWLAVTNKMLHVGYRAEGHRLHSRWASRSDWEWVPPYRASLQTSHLDLAMHAASGTARMLWTMELGDSAWRQTEAWFQIAVPRGAVVTEATLWVKGMPREAVFASTAKATEAFEQVVSQRLDPILVSWRADHIVHLRAFPIPVRDAPPMKLRVGLTVPLEVTDQGALCSLPEIVASDLRIAPELEHRVWLETDVEPTFAPQGLGSTVAIPGGYRMRGSLRATDLAAVLLPMSPIAGAIGTAPSPGAPDKQVLVSLERPAARAFREAVIVLDGGIATSHLWPEICDAIAALGPAQKLRLVLAADEPIVIEKTPAQVAARLRKHYPAGGPPLMESLLRGCEIALQNGMDQVLVVRCHEYQDSAPRGAIDQFLERNVIAVSELPLAPPNLNEAGLATGHARLPRYGTITQSIGSAWNLVTGRTKKWIFHRKEIPAQGGPSNLGAGQGKLWLAAKTNNAFVNQELSDDLIARAVRARLVTRATSAVVLETDRQYKDAGLEPPDPKEASVSIPSIPEPHEWALLGVTVVAIVFLSFRARGQRKAASSAPQAA